MGGGILTRAHATGSHKEDFGFIEAQVAEKARREQIWLATGVRRFFNTARPTNLRLVFWSCLFLPLNAPHSARRLGTRRRSPPSARHHYSPPSTRRRRSPPSVRPFRCHLLCVLFGATFPVSLSLTTVRALLLVATFRVSLTRCCVCSRLRRG